MNDNELSSVVRESVAGMRSATPVDQIITRGRAVRTWRRVPAAAAALVVVGGAALGMTAFTPTGHSTSTSAGRADSHPSVVRLAAWTVVKRASGEIDITIRQLDHPAQLQATLRADGLPVNVDFNDYPSKTVCRPYANPYLLGRTSGYFHMRGGAEIFTLNPVVLPSGIGLTISVEENKSAPGEVGALQISLVHATQQCTG